MLEKLRQLQVVAFGQPEQQIGFELGDFARAGVENLDARLKNLKRDPWAAFFKTDQTLPIPKRKR